MIERTKFLTFNLLIGKFLMQNHEIVFDIDNKKIGFSKI